MFVFKAAVAGSEERVAVVSAALSGAGVELTGLAAADLVVITGLGDDLGEAQELVSAIDEQSRGIALFAIDSADLPVTELADATMRPGLVVGFHLGAEGSGVVEVAAGEDTDRQALQTAVAFAQAIKRQPVVCAESPGLIATRIADDAKEIAGEAGADDAGDLPLLLAACSVLEEGIATHRDIDLALMRGADRLAPPFMTADTEGLDEVLTRIADAESRWGAAFAAPSVLLRLVAQGRLGKKAGQGFYPYARPDSEQVGEVVAVETRGDVAIAWLQNPPMNAVSPQLVKDLNLVYDQLEAQGVRALVITSGNPMVFSAGADLKAFTTLDEQAGAQYVLDTQNLFTRLGEGPIATVAAVNGLAFGGGNELAMACDVRIAAESALFGQPEIRLGLIPGFGGTQRLARLVGESRAKELNLIGDPITADDALEYGLVTRVVADHELFDLALAWGKKLAKQAPLAVAKVKQTLMAGELSEGIEREIAAFGEVFNSEDGREGVSAFLEKRAPTWRGQ